MIMQGMNTLSSDWRAALEDTSIIAGHGVADTRAFMSDWDFDDEDCFTAGKCLTDLAYWLIFSIPSGVDVSGFEIARRPRKIGSLVKHWLSLPRSPIELNELRLCGDRFLLVAQDNTAIDIRYFSLFARYYWPLEFYRLDGDEITIMVCSEGQPVGVIARFNVQDLPYTTVYQREGNAWRFLHRVIGGVFLSGHLEALREADTRQAIAAELQRLLSAGYVIVFPPSPQKGIDSYRNHLVHLAGCDALLVPLSQTNPMVLAEIAVAERIGLDIQYIHVS